MKNEQNIRIQFHTETLSIYDARQNRKILVSIHTQK